MRHVPIICSCVAIFSFASFAVPAGGPTTTQTTSSSAVKRFQIKSGIITMQIDMTAPMVMSGTTTLYFDQFGAKQATVSEMSMDMMGMKINTKTKSITKDGYIYSLDLDKKTGTRTRPCRIDDPAKMDWSAFGDAMKKKWNLKKEGTEEVAGKSCDVYSFSTDDIEASSDCAGTKSSTKVAMAGKSWVWNNIGLKNEFTMGGGVATKATTTRIEENVAVPAGMFDVPADVKVQDQK